MKTILIEKEYTAITSWNKCPVCGRRKWYAMQATKGGFNYMLLPPLVAVVDFTEGDPKYADECVNCGTVVV